MFNRPGVTYESAQTRKYQLGRTEVIRSASKESKAWAEAMLNPQETVSLSCQTPSLASTDFWIMVGGIAGRQAGDAIPESSRTSPAIRGMGCGRTGSRQTLFRLEEAPQARRACPRGLQGSFIQQVESLATFHFKPFQRVPRRVGLRRRCGKYSVSKKLVLTVYLML